MHNSFITLSVQIQQNTHGRVRIRSTRTHSLDFEPTSICSYSLLRKEGTNTNFIVFELTRPRFELQARHHRCGSPSVWESNSLFLICIYDVNYIWVKSTVQLSSFNMKTIFCSVLNQYLSLSSNHHFRWFKWIMITCPCSPFYSISKTCMATTKIFPIQIGSMARSVPPTTKIGQRTCNWTDVVILIFCGELHPIMSY